MFGTLLRHERILVLTALSAAAVIAWAYLLLGSGIGDAGQMNMGGGQMMRMAPAWTSGYAALIFLMWTSMMVAMMLPGTAPTILLVSALMRARGGNHTLGPTGLFVLGYLTVWFGVSMVGTTLQWGLHRIGILSAGMATTSSTLAALLLIVAGLYQWTPLKQACLVRCRSPAEQLSRYWRSGAIGPFLSGIRNGGFCLGCCWLLMLLLFVGGVMNLLWVAVLTVLVLIEKAFPVSAYSSRLTGTALIAWGTAGLLA